MSIFSNNILSVRTRLLSIFLTVFLSCLCGNTFLEPTSALAEEIPEHFVPIRPLGMGNAFTAVANDDNAIWTNPAGISRVRKARSRKGLHLLRFPNAIAGANSAGRSFYEGFKSSQEKSVSSIVENLEDLGDKPFWARAAAAPIALFDAGRGNPMSFGLASNTTTKAFISTDTPEQARVEAVADAYGILGFAFTNRTNRLTAGIQARPMFRYAYQDTIPSEDIINKEAMKTRIENDSTTFTGVGADFGFLYTFADFWFPTFGLSVLNLPTGCRDNYLNPFSKKRETVCGNALTGTIANAEAPPSASIDPMDFRVGLAISPRITRTIGLRIAVDAHHIPLGSGDTYYGLQGIEASKLIHAGAELYMGNPLLISPFSVRTGYNQGFATFGFSIDLKLFTIEFATYGIDVSSTSKSVEDRRYLGSLSFDF